MGGRAAGAMVDTPPADADAERVAEGLWLWRTVLAKPPPGPAPRAAWIALPEAEKAPWRERARGAIRAWTGGTG